MRYYKIFFLVLCLLLLVIPLTHMNKDAIATQENRTLATFPLTRKDDKPNYEFGKEFERWLGDRFWGRTHLISARFWMMYAINGRIENDEAFVGDNGWMFDKSKIVRVPSLDKQREKIENDADILKQFAAKFKDRNITIYLVMIPDREVLYQKYWEKHYPSQPRLDYGDELMNALKDYPNVRIADPKQVFTEKRDIGIFRKYDEHVNDHGAIILAKFFYECLGKDVREFKKDFPLKISVQMQSNETIWPPHLANLLHIPVPSEFVQTIQVEKQEHITVIENVNETYIETQNDFAYSDKHVYILGGCYGFDTLFPVLKSLFQFTTMIRTNHISDTYDEQINRAVSAFNHLKQGDIIVVMGNDFTLNFLKTAMDKNRKH